MKKPTDKTTLFYDHCAEIAEDVVQLMDTRFDLSYFSLSLCNQGLLEL